MSGNDVCMLVFDGFADWEPAYALAELRRWGKRHVITAGFTAAAVTTMGGVRVLPDATLDDIRPADLGLFLLPGGDAWESEYPRARLESFLQETVAAGVPIAAICGATIALARAGLLNDRRHTSNLPSYLGEHAPEYDGAALYDSSLAVRDRGVITGSGLGPVDFAREVFAELGIFSEADAQLWYDMFKHGKLPAGMA